MALVCFNKIPIYPIFYLLKGDHRVCKVTRQGGYCVAFLLEKCGDAFRRIIRGRTLDKSHTPSVALSTLNPKIFGAHETSGTAERTQGSDPVKD